MKIPVPKKSDRIAHPIRTNVTSHPKYSAIPPHTPASIFCDDDFVNFLMLVPPKVDYTCFSSNSVILMMPLSTAACNVATLISSEFCVNTRDLLDSSQTLAFFKSK